MAAWAEQSKPADGWSKRTEVIDTKWDSGGTVWDSDTVWDNEWVDLVAQTDGWSKVV